MWVCRKDAAREACRLTCASLAGMVRGMNIREHSVRRVPRLAAALLLWQGTLCAMLAAGEAERPAQWAKPLSLPGLPNLHQVDEGLYRGAQPTAEGMQGLQKLGVKTVICLRSLHAEREEKDPSGLTVVHIPMTPLHVSDALVVRFLKVATDKERRPVFVHCRQGADRTGVMCAAYRIAVQGWTKDEAVREMTEGGFGHHAVFDNLTEYLREANFEKIRREAGLSPPDKKAEKKEPQMNADRTRRRGSHAEDAEGAEEAERMGKRP